MLIVRRTYVQAASGVVVWAPAVTTAIPCPSLARLLLRRAAQTNRWTLVEHKYLPLLSIFQQVNLLSVHNSVDWPADYSSKQSCPSSLTGQKDSRLTGSFFATYTFAYDFPYFGCHKYIISKETYINTKASAWIRRPMPNDSASWLSKEVCRVGPWRAHRSNAQKHDKDLVS